MRVGKILLVGLFISGLSISAAFAQPADDRAVYADNADNYTRADKTTPANVSYQTVGKALPYYVAPSTISHPDLAAPRDHVVLPAGDLKATWNWIANPTVGITIVPAANMATITVNTANTTYDIDVHEVGSCGDGEPSKIKIIGTSEPKLEITAAEVIGKTPTADNVTLPGAGVITEIQNFKGIVLKSCDKTDFTGQQIKLTLKSTEEGILAADQGLRKYSFSINYVIYRHKTDGTYVIDGVKTQLVEHPLATKFAVLDATDVTFNIPAIPDPALDEDYVEVIFFLGGAETRTGIVSSISHRSDNPIDPGFTAPTSYDFDLTKNLVATARLTAKPKTGPIYHIPYNY